MLVPFKQKQQCESRSEGQRAAKKRKVTFADDIQWACCGQRAEAVCAEIVGDNECVINWCNAESV
eukprot:7391361-Lingulodinium_polyedra.AAC.1